MIRIASYRPFANESEWCVRANQRCASRSVRAYFRAVSRLGDGVFWYALMMLLIAFGGMRGSIAALQLAATGLVSLALYKVLKRWARRPRPCAADTRIMALIAPLDEFSFPSGHTLHAVAFSCIAIAHFPWLAWVLVPFSASVALSRVMLGLHYPSDVLAAFAIGIALGKLSLVAGNLIGLLPAGV